MAKELTKKQKGFVKDYVKTGNGVQSALKNYDTKDYSTAGVIAVENLEKPKIRQAIEDALPNALLNERHLELLNKRESHIWYEEIKNAEGKKVDTKVHRIDLGPEVQAVSKGLDMAYKIKGSYAPEKHVNLNIPIPIYGGESIRSIQEHNSDPEDISADKEDTSG